MKTKRKRREISKKTYKKIGNLALVIIFVLAIISIMVSISSYIVPYTEANVLLCHILHKVSIATVWMLFILLGVFVFCDDK